MAKQHQRLVLQHLEDVSWRVLQEYPDVVREMIRGRHGVYALYRRGRLYYVGLASNLMGRLKTHLRDRHREQWDRFSVFLTVRDSHMKELESLILRIVAPPGNKTGGRFASSINLKPELNRNIRNRDADSRAELVGGPVKRLRRRSNAARKTGRRILEGAVERSTRLKGTLKGQDYRAILRRDGRITYNGYIYDSPSGAGRDAIGRSCNGWSFWLYRDQKSGKWVPIGSLRR